MNKFNQKEYVKQYAKEHYKQFKCSLKIKEMEKINKLLKEHDVSKHELVMLGLCVLETGLTPLMLCEKEHREVNKRDRALSNISDYACLNDITIEELRAYIIKEFSKVFNE